jgi:hypothetical protein
MEDIFMGSQDDKSGIRFRLKMSKTRSKPQQFGFQQPRIFNFSGFSSLRNRRPQTCT